MHPHKTRHILSSSCKKWVVNSGVSDLKEMTSDRLNKIRVSPKETEDSFDTLSPVKPFHFICLLFIMLNNLFTNLVKDKIINK